VKSVRSTDAVGALAKPGFKVGDLVRARESSDEWMIAILQGKGPPAPLLIISETYRKRNDGLYEKSFELLENDRMITHLEPYLERYYEVVNAEV